MKNIIITVVAVIALTGFLAYRTLTPQDRQPSSSKIAESVKIYDVRTQEEYNASHVPSAVLLPVTDIQQGKYPAVSKDTAIAVYCRSGNRSAEATKLLKQAGFTNVQDLGGLNDLSKHGLRAE